MLTKSEISTAIHTEWQLLEQFLAGLTEAQILAPGAVAAWSVKDALAHIAAWQKVLLEQVDAFLTHRPATYPPVRTQTDVDRVNAAFFAQNQDQPWPVVILECRSLYTAVLAMLEALDGSILAAPVPADWAEDAPTLAELICANTCDHYREHRQQLEHHFYPKGDQI